MTLAALAAVAELAPGERCVLLTREEPGLLMTALNLRLRDALAWETVAGADHWRTTVWPASDTPPRDLIETLTRDHHRLDELLGRALRQLNAGDTARAKELLDEFAFGLRRHAHAENDLVAPALGPAADFEPLEIMLREHAELLDQLRVVQECFVEAPAGQLPQAWEVEPFAAILSGTLAKHEYREEGGLFPAWSAKLAAWPAGEREALQARVQQALADAGAGPDCPR